MSKRLFKQYICEDTLKNINSSVLTFKIGDRVVEDNDTEEKNVYTVLASYFQVKNNLARDKFYENILVSSDNLSIPDKIRSACYFKLATKK